MRRYAIELIGTFFLVLTIGFTAVQGTALAPLAIGSILMVMVYMGGPISGGHYNPAVTLAVWLRGRTPVGDVLPYMAAQALGALLAAWVVQAVAGATFAPAPGPEVGVGGMVTAELLYTFALALVVLNTATARGTEGNSYYGLAIGFTVLAGAWAVGPISGAAFNPAVGLGPTVVHALAGAGGWQHLWVYLLAPLLGGLAAGLFFRWQSGAD
ncbi:MAG TPA: aquaporin [Thermoanaerobaculia bacterium]|nr:aquaporin [Thermoanaerobaculia bacterium]